VNGISLSIASTGRDVLVVGMPATGTMEDTKPRIVSTDPLSDGSVSTVTRGPLPGDPVRRQWAHHVRGARDALDLIEGIAIAPPSHIIVYGTVATPLVQVLRWGRAHRVSVLADIVERYSPVQFRAGPVSPSYASATVGFAAVAPRVDGVIAISRYLESHFSARGVPTVRIPPTSDLSLVPVGESSDEGLVFGYLGSPGRKDFLDIVVESFVRVRRVSGMKDMRLVVGGPGTREALASRHAQDLEGVDLRGRIPQQDIPAILGSLTATVLARPPSRYAQAGYPTKVVESLGVGTPVVCNLTSDLADVVREGVTGWVSMGPTVEEMSLALCRVVATSAEDLRWMRQRARAVAEEHFDFGRHVELLDAFLGATA
jgi:glycosyltransferase involved in cell wall biosynthesis